MIHPAMDQQERARTGSLAAHGAVLSFHHINYSVDLAGGCSSKKNMKHILRDVSGLFKPGMNAIMGPTGGGKSSFLDVLAGRKDPAGLSGDLLVDGKKQPKNFRNQSGYVVQDDMIMGTLTVKENITMSANLRLPKHVSSSDRKQRVENILVELGLTNCANSKVGTAYFRGVSGGERKRTSIGMELITSPSVLFLDEPTTGLDANTAHSVMSLLTRLSKGGHTIIFSIHQPRFSIYNQFDRLMLLGQGQPLFHGPGNEAITYLAKAGYICEAYNNPPDFFLDVVNGSVKKQGEEDEDSGKKGQEKNGSRPASKASLNTTQNEDGSVSVFVDPDMHTEKSSKKNGRRSTIPMDDMNAKDGGPDDDMDVEKERKRIKAIIDNLVAMYRESEWFTNVQNELKLIYDQFDPNIGAEAGPEHASGIGTQVYHLSIRASLDMFRNPQSSYIHLAVAIVMALVVGVIYWDIDNDITSGIQNRTGAFFFVTLCMIFFNMSAIEIFISDRALFLHESLGGYYNTSAYFLTKIIFDMIPSRTIPAIAFTVITYFMIGFEHDVETFLVYFGTLWLTSMAAVSVHFAIAAGQSVFAIANLLVMMVHVFSMIFGGLLVNVQDVVVWLRWIQYLSIFRYSTNVLCINELEDISLCADTGNSSTCVLGYGEAYLESQGIDYETNWDMGKNLFALGVIIVGCLFLAYLQLRCAKRYK